MAESGLEMRGRVEQVRKVVLNRRGNVTIGDIMGDTGLGQEDAKAALDSLIRTHEGSLRVSQNGDLLYAFRPNVALRDEQSWWESHKAAIYGGLVNGFRILFMLVMLFYFIMPLLILLMPVFLVWFMLSILFLPVSPLWNLFGFNDAVKARLRKFFRRSWGFLLGYHLKKKAVSDVVPKYKTPFHVRLCHFVFGMETFEGDDLAEARIKCARLIQYKKGVITAEDWMLVTGDSFEKAESDLARLTAVFGGSAEITENGTLIYIFEDMMKSTRQIACAYPPTPVWNNLETPIPLSGNPDGGSRGIILMNLFLLLIFGRLTSLGIEDIIVNPDVDTANVIFKTVFAFIPFLLSLFIFIVPLFRLPKTIQKNRERRRRSLKKAALSAFEPFFHDKTHETIRVSQEAFVDAIRQWFDIFQMRPVTHSKECQATINEICHDLEGREISEAAEAFSFDAMSIRLQDAENERQKRRLDKQTLGHFVYSSDDAEQHALDHAMEQRELASFDQVLQGQQTSSHARREGEPKSLQELLPKAQDADSDAIMAQFYKNRDAVIHVLRTSLQTRYYDDAEILIRQYDPEIFQDDTYSDLVQKVRKGIVQGQKLACLEELVEAFFFEMIVCPRTFLFIGVFGILSLFSVELGSTSAFLIVLGAMIGACILCTELWFNPLKNANNLFKSLVSILLFFIVLGMCVPDTDETVPDGASSVEDVSLEDEAGS